MAYRDLALTFLITVLGGVCRLEFELWMTRKERARQLSVSERHLRVSEMILEALKPNGIR